MGIKIPGVVTNGTYSRLVRDDAGSLPFPFIANTGAFIPYCLPVAAERGRGKGHCAGSIH